MIRKHKGSFSPQAGGLIRLKRLLLAGPQIPEEAGAGVHKKGVVYMHVPTKERWRSKVLILPTRCVTLGCFIVVTFLIFSQGDWLFDIFMGVEIHD